MEERAVDKTCSDCKCRNCSPITAMAERQDAYLCAQSMLQKVTWPDDNPPTPHEYLLLANWLYYGGQDDND